MKTLIIYFSWSNNTKRLVEKVNQEFNFDVIRIERKNPYSDDYNECAYVEAKEEVTSRKLPEIKKNSADFNSFSRILLFFPIWWYTFPMPIGTLLKELKGYKGEVILFENSYTNDPQYINNSLKDAKELNSELNIKQGLFNKSVESHIKYIKKL